MVTSLFNGLSFYWIHWTLCTPNTCTHIRVYEYNVSVCSLKHTHKYVHAMYKEYTWWTLSLGQSARPICARSYGFSLKPIYYNNNDFFVLSYNYNTICIATLCVLAACVKWNSLIFQLWAKQRTRVSLLQRYVQNVRTLVETFSGGKRALSVTRRYFSRHVFWNIQWFLAYNK